MNLLYGRIERSRIQSCYAPTPWRCSAHTCVHAAEDLEGSRLLAVKDENLDLGTAYYLFMLCDCVVCEETILVCRN
jgi:hypothetical protein